MCEEQLSVQKHYDWGLRNINSVLRRAGDIKRDAMGEDEAMLLMRTLRDMNLSKLVADDVRQFLDLLKDIFPGLPEPKKVAHGEIDRVLDRIIKEEEIIHHDDWVLKIQQVY